MSLASLVWILRTVVFFLCEATNAKSRISVCDFLSIFFQLQLNLISGLYRYFHLQYPPKMRYGKTSPWHHSSAYYVACIYTMNHVIFDRELSKVWNKPLILYLKMFEILCRRPNYVSKHIFIKKLSSENLEE